MVQSSLDVGSWMPPRAAPIPHTTAIAAICTTLSCSAVPGSLIWPSATMCRA
jgi:hypothetical protein